MVEIACKRVKTHKLLQVCKQVVTSLFTSYQQALYRLLTICSKLVDNLQQAVRTQLVDGLHADLLVRFLRGTDVFFNILN